MTNRGPGGQAKSILFTYISFIRAAPATGPQPPVGGGAGEGVGPEGPLWAPRSLAMRGGGPAVSSARNQGQAQQQRETGVGDRVDTHPPQPDHADMDEAQTRTFLGTKPLLLAPAREPKNATRSVLGPAPAWGRMSSQLGLKGARMAPAQVPAWRTGRSSPHTLADTHSHTPQPRRQAGRKAGRCQVAGLAPGPRRAGVWCE